MPLVAVYRRGPGWVDARALEDQPTLAEHIAYLTAAVRAGALVHAGPFHELGAQVHDDPVGLVVFAGEARDLGEAFVADDPAVRSGVLECEIFRWYT